MKSFTLPRTARALVAASFTVGSCYAAELIWTGPSGTTGAPVGGTWDLSAIAWNDGVGDAANSAWVATNDAVFSGPAGTYAINVGESLSVPHMRFLGSGYTLSAASAQTISITANEGVTLVPQIYVASGATATIGANVLVQNSANFQLFIGTEATTAGGTLNIEGTVKQNSSNTGGINGVGTVVNVNAGGQILGPNNGGGSGGFVVGLTEGSDATLNVNSGGTFNNQDGNQALFVGVGGTGVLNVNSGGTVVLRANASSNGLTIGNTASAVGTVNLNAGGTITTRIVRTNNASASSTFNLNGGTLQANVANPTFMEGLTRVNIRNGGAVIDTNNVDITIGQSLQHSNIDGDNAIDGGLTKIGFGTLTLAAANSYTGVTDLQAGTLQISASGAIAASSQLNVASFSILHLQHSASLDDAIVLTLGQDAIVNLDYVGTEIVGAMTVNGVEVTPGLYSVNDLNSQFGDAVFLGNGDALLAVAVPEPGVFALLGVAGAVLLFLRSRRRSATD